jgi:plastocyanin
MRPVPAALLLASLWTPAAAATIAGRIRVELEPSARVLRPNVSALGARTPEGRPDRSRSVVYLESAPQTAFGQPPARAAMDQSGETFVPYVLPISVGTTVDFPNSDPVFHNVFSLSRTRRFDLGRYAGGQSKSVRFDRPGIVRVFCDIHSHMSAFILVFAHSYFASTDEAGRYRIEGVPPGRYTLVVWTDGEERSRREVTVREGTEQVAQDFTVEAR